MSDNVRKRFAGHIRASFVVTILVMVVAGLFFTASAFGQESTESTESTATVSAARAEVQKFGLIAAAAAFGLGAIGAGIAIGNVGSAAMGTIGEKPELAGQALIFIALAEGLVVFGFITALMILGKV
ncbi:ATP synthase subunit C [Sediminispirochaeta smaragdinae]|jgi:V/A-type H+-transporting ATPase subunit K|uniref:H+transporting two-sector ATPase C subunit n=1 Tax=Sediminispirochaeta smaragdinae (strain DSM 11293 / JCM 15392 / SEBR 4228) TaxID=573413 RepID=E1R4X1_SEDSS|nr:ATP synthase subunit C [Sediminispirochaeta smaragdinae]ADK82209.1 H+transporting two-sector ATPase C subunit [Sediminispirochaeta smaragdinae DSM 11293]